MVILSPPRLGGGAEGGVVEKNLPPRLSATPPNLGGEKINLFKNFE